MTRILAKRGFPLSPQSGNHKIYKHKLSGKRVTVPLD
ncbi:MAG: type II toxin-antitoxin system HicA family toxin [Chloroflexi bacterium]|nr:type II toxin-antitoxin system HicA family toxin [Chloroflexota bacterium]